MPLLSRSEYNLILRSFDYYDFKMNNKEKELREQIEEKLYNNCYNPKDKVAQTNVNLAALYDIKTEKIKENKITQDMVDASLATPMWYEKNNEFDTPLAEEYGG